MLPALSSQGALCDEGVEDVCFGSADTTPTIKISTRASSNTTKVVPPLDAAFRSTCRTPFSIVVQAMGGEKLPYTHRAGEIWFSELRVCTEYYSADKLNSSGIHRAGL